jgi:hypothetical protein
MANSSVLTVLALGGMLVIGCKEEPAKTPAPTPAATQPAKGNMPTTLPGGVLPATFPSDLKGGTSLIPKTMPSGIPMGSGTSGTGGTPTIKLPSHPTTLPSGIPGGTGVPDFNK